MKLQHYRLLYKDALIEYLDEQDKGDLIAEIADRYTIKDWKTFEKELNQLESEDDSGK